MPPVTLEEAKELISDRSLYAGELATCLCQLLAQPLTFERELVMLIFRYGNGFLVRLMPRPKGGLALGVSQGVRLPRPAPASLFRYR